MKKGLLIAILNLIYLSQFSAENVELNIPRYSICACVGETLNYTCTVAVDAGSATGSTLWKGSAFMCVGNEISLIHASFMDGTPESRGCNGGDIVARSVDVEGMRYTSELKVRISAELNGKTVNCSWDSRSHQNSSTITVAGACGDVRPIINLTNVSPGQLTFMWSRLDSECSTVQYLITSDCGSCPRSVIDETLATCSDLQPSETGRNCTFSVMSMTRGYSGIPSIPIMVTLKVPSAPQVLLTPVYSGQELIKLIAEIIPMEDFSIYEGRVSGAVENYIIHYLSDFNSTVSASSNCGDSICEYEVDVPPSVCLTQHLSEGIMVSVSAANRLGPGQATEPISIGCTNRIVTVTGSTATLTCQFQSSQISVEKTCHVDYSVCGQEQVISTEGNSTLETPNRVILQLSLPSGSDCYTYTVTASDGVSTVIVEGKIAPAKGDSVPVNTITVAVVVSVAVVILISATIVVTITCVYRQGRYKKHPASKDHVDGKFKLAAQPSIVEDKTEVKSYDNVKLSDTIIDDFDDTTIGD